MPKFSPFLKLIESRLESSRIKKSELSRLCGRQERYIANMINEGTEPKVSVAADICRHLNVSLDETYNLGSDNGAPNLHEVMGIHAQHGGLTEAFHPIWEFCDQYAAPTPKSKRLQPIRIGASTEVAKTLGKKLKLFQLSLAAFCLTSRGRKLVSDYKAAAERGILLTEEILDGTAPEVNIRVVRRYHRLLLLTKAQDGKHTILNFSFMI